MEVIDLISDRPAFKLIRRKYEGKVARRSGVSYLNHIIEGAFILKLLYGPNAELADAYCLHPLFQNDRSLADIIADQTPELSQVPPRVIILTMEYRRVANGYTIKDRVRPADSIDIGPLADVHKMLVADKIQNKKDFMKYMYRKHDRPSYRRASEHSVQYFDRWLERLGVGDETYQTAVARLEASNLYDA